MKIKKNGTTCCRINIQHIWSEATSCCHWWTDSVLPWLLAIFPKISPPPYDSSLTLLFSYLSSPYLTSLWPSISFYFSLQRSSPQLLTMPCGEVDGKGGASLFPPKTKSHLACVSSTTLLQCESSCSPFQSQQGFFLTKFSQHLQKIIYRMNY